MAVLRSNLAIYWKLHASYNERIIRLYDSKTISYGSYIEFYYYQAPKLTFSPQRIYYQKARRGTRKSFSLTRSRESVYRLSEANVYRHGNYKPVFFTLTTKDQCTEYKESNRKIKGLIRRLNHYLGYQVKYLIVPELHEKGGIHYHGIFFNVPYIPVRVFRFDIWKHGYIDLQLPKKIKSVSRYLAKYITKEFSENTPLHTKLYFTSRGLYRPIQEFDYKPITGTIKNRVETPHVVITKTFVKEK